MAIDPAVIGSRTPVFSTEAERGRLRFFAQACGQTDPVYSDLRAAEAAGHRDLPFRRRSCSVWRWTTPTGPGS